MKSPEIPQRVPDRLVLNPSAMQRIRRIATDLTAFAPPLEPEDVVLQTIDLVLVSFGEGFLPRERNLAEADFRRLVGLSIGGVIRAIPRLARSTGLVSRVVDVPDTRVERAFQWYFRMNAKRDELTREAADAVRRGDAMAPRAHALGYLECRLPCLFADVDAHVLRRIDEKRERGETPNSHDSSPRDGRDVIARERSGAATLLSLMDQHGALPLLRTGADGRIRVGLQARDRLRSRKKIDRTVSMEEPATPWDDDVTTIGSVIESAEAGNPLDLASQLELVGRVQAIRKARRARAREGSARAAVLDHIVELTTGVMSGADLAQRTGLDRSAITKSFTEEKLLIQSEVLRALGGETPA